MRISTIGFAGHRAEAFFGALRAAGATTVIDVRLRPGGQLSGFAKQDDLAWFLHELAGIGYRHEPSLAPTDELLRRLRAPASAGGGGPAERFATFAGAFVELLEARHVAEELDRAAFAGHTVLLCSEHGPERCHRRLVAEHLASRWGEVEVVHL